MHAVLVLALSGLTAAALSNAAFPADSPQMAAPVSAPVSAPLPPVLPWQGESEKLLENVPAEWLTPAEKSHFVRTPDANETLAFLQKLDKASPYIQLLEFGKSGDNRPLWLVIASTDGEKDLAKRKRSDKARVLMQAGIHAGEIDGKDAGLMVLRDIARGKSVDLLRHSDWFFIPILNVDGHERRGPIGHTQNMRVNQRGPDNMGWRTNARNLNLNRDYAKADAPEMQALLGLFNVLDPELYLDIHVTDGIDYQYDITYGFNDDQPHSPASAQWLQQVFRSSVDRGLSLSGHIPGDLVFALDALHPDKGLSHWNSNPRFSQGYGDIRHMPTVLVENHSLKPYRQRVLGTHVLITQSLRIAGDQRLALRQAIANDRQQRRAHLPLNFGPDATRMETRSFAGIAFEHYDSSISGQKEIRWLGKEQDQQIPAMRGKAAVQLLRPKAYWLPAHRRDLIDRLRIHGVMMETQKNAVEKSLGFYRLPQAKIGSAAFEGRVGAVVGTVQEEQQTRAFAAGSVRISTDQPLGDLVMALLEPQSDDSFFAWGFFHDILQATEYMEPYVTEPMAAAMLAQDPALRDAFNAALKDPAFAGNPEARLDWFYQRSPYADQDWKLYPVGIER